MSDQTAAATAAIGTVMDEVAPELSRTYAEALINAAEGDSSLGIDAILDELDELVADLWRGRPLFAGLLSSPSLSSSEKDRILVSTLEGKALPIVLRFLRVLNRHGRLGLLVSTVRDARALWNKRQNRVAVFVRSAVPLGDEELAELADRLGELTKGVPMINQSVDPSLIGGLVVQIGDVVHDASLRTRLNRLRDRLFERKSHEIQSRRDHFSHTA